MMSLHSRRRVRAVYAPCRKAPRPTKPRNRSVASHVKNTRELESNLVIHGHGRSRQLFVTSEYYVQTVSVDVSNI